ncbi:MAG: ATP-binding protein, partial [Candidatus Eremiobacteraeota bacterium]|nr:ATP-binding protein [Candidatus Eremiobacteraeota bacterium]
ADDQVPTLRFDPTLIRRVFNNLLQNALVHGAAADGTLAVRVIAHRIADGVLFAVADHGPGVPPEYRELIFRKFETFRVPANTRGSGSGLGLAFCKLAVEAHGGRIWVQDRDGGGALFRVLLPLTPGLA